MFGELRVLSALSLQGASVPRPAGAVVQPMIAVGGAAVYRGLIMTEELPQTANYLSAALAACRTAAAVPAEITEIARRAGCEARRCLDLGVFIRICIPAMCCLILPVAFISSILTRPSWLTIAR